MKLNRANHDSGELIEFYEAGLGALGALCERTWHDRLEVVAEGRSATLWNANGTLHEVELRFAPADASTARDAAREVFPGCPLTFQLAEALCDSPPPLERFMLPDPTPPRPPELVVAEKLWRAQFPDTRRWELAAPFAPDMHFSLLALARCEIQAMDQHWLLHRLAVSLPGGELDDHLAREIGFHQAAGQAGAEIAWPTPEPASWSRLLQRALDHELAEDLARIRARQENSLRREWDRIEDYFGNYERELSARAGRGPGGNSKIKAADRLAAAKAEHARRRADQLARHEIRILPHVDALLLVAETAWHASLRLETEHAHPVRTVKARFVPRLRRWRL